MEPSESHESKDNTPAWFAYKKNKFLGSYEQLAHARIKCAFQLPTNGPSVSPISYRITRSARSSWSVGSRLMITRRAPQFLAISGNPAAGQTTSDDPIARNRSQCCESSVARCIASPNEMVAVLTGSSQTVQSGAAPSSSKRCLTHDKS